MHILLLSLLQELCILDALACIPDERRQFREVEGGLEGLRDILHNIERAWRGGCENNFRCELEKRACLAARILGKLALDKELRETIALLPGVQEGLLFLQIIEMWKSGIHSDSVCNSTRALTIIYVNFEYARLACPQAVEELQRVLCSDQFSSSKRMAVHEEEVYATVYCVRALAHVKVGAHDEALADLDVASHLNVDRFRLAAHANFNTLPLWDDYLHVIRESFLHCYGNLMSYNSFSVQTPPPSMWHAKYSLS
ncbi:unnamed protein product [Calypogeia fissa]